MKFIPKHCHHCLGECPENCESCIYAYCKKPVDEALVFFRYNHMINKIDDNREWVQFHEWFRKYFNIN